MTDSCPGDPPSEKGEDNHGQHGRHEDLDDLVDQTLDVGFAGLGLLGHDRHLGELTVGSHADGSRHDASGEVHRSAQNR